MPAKREHPGPLQEGEPAKRASVTGSQSPQAARGQGAEDVAAGKGARTKAAQRAAAQAAIDAVTVRSERRSPREAAAPKHAADAAAGQPPRHVSINRAPVLTLWAAAVAQREGHSWDAGLSFGREISGLLAQSKGRSLGIYEKKERTEEEQEARRRRDREAGVERVEVFGMHLPAIKVGGEARGASEGHPVDPSSVDTYLRRAFGAALPAVKEVMEALASAVPKKDIGRVAYKLYERFRPAWHGWGAKGDLDLQLLRELAAGAWRESL